MCVGGHLAAVAIPHWRSSLERGSHTIINSKIRNSDPSLYAIRRGGGSSQVEEETEVVSTSSSPLNNLLVKMGYKSEDGAEREDNTRSLKEKLKSGMYVYVYTKASLSSRYVILCHISMPLQSMYIY